MPESKPEPQSEIEFEVEVRQPLGYRSLHPVCGSSMELALWNVVNRLDAKQGDRLVFVVRKLRDEKE